MVSSDLVFLSFHGNNKLVLRKSMRESYDSVVRLANRQFPETRGKAVEIRVDLDEVSRVAVTQEAWCTFAESRDADGVERYTVEVIPGDVEESQAPGSSAGLLQDIEATPKRLAKRPDQGKLHRLKFRMVRRIVTLDLVSSRSKGPILNLKALYDGDTFLVKVVGSTKIGAILDAVLAQLNFVDGELPLNVDFKAVYEDTRLNRADTVAGREMEDGDEIILLREQLGGKPVIYLRSPTELDATVEVSLVHDWSFSALYPVVPTKSPKSSRLHQCAEWQVRTALDGTMVDKRSGAEVSYLFWEAITNSPSGQDSPPPSPILAPQDVFRPAMANNAFKHATSVALAVDDVPLYLDAALFHLGLDTEARTSFITYWLPSFLHHEHILLSFVPQSAYEAAAPLSVVPTPNVITRIFMIFRALDADDRELWEGKEQREAVMWRAVVGVPEKKQQTDSALFMVLEWGGMEVKH
ncbi:Ubiquitin family protein [Mycena chlorophos]|uniref:Ubiquitin family protein n=1 Tax=Mycena chlorophos TaxID=658473 RepID=A0A8H6VWZ7_MYCCL|nr:Ubiquitin family protein [Mycena chlorophos]